MKFKCKDCKKYLKTQSEEYGVCSLPYSYFPTKDDDDCHYLSESDIKCKDCVRFGEDFACFTADENDDASDCAGFIDIEEERVSNSFFVWLKRGIYSRKKILKLCDEFEQSEEYKFFQSMNKESNSGE
ncbi:MAG: hypothetical protein K2H19_06625 [Ruminococcus sp.]|nr:hypothetical protein [Ruminococcus sp.]